MEINISELEKFLYDANKNGYAGNGKKVDPPQRPEFSELEYQNGNWLMHDSYAGHFFAPGQEIVYYQSKPVWAMAYAGGMKFKYHGDEEVTHRTFVFLKKALLAMNPANPFRGPEKLIEEDFEYVSSVDGGTKEFAGNEKIYLKDKLVFEQNFIGGVIVERSND